jgi:aspartate dehydrogenase
VKADTPTRKIGILGVGSIGQSLARAVEQKDIDAELVALSDQDREKAEAFAASLSSHPPVVPTGELIEHAELIVEAASQAVLPEFVPMALARVRDMLIMSVGGLLGHEEWFREAGEKGCRIYIPSGAIAGLDGIQSASMGRLESAVLTSRKPIAALAGTQFVLDRGVQLHSFKQETVIFEGSAEEAARAFPTTSNVAATLRLAIAPALPVRVRVVAVPGGSKNVHEIEVQGEFGRLAVSVENVPSTVNPRTSQLAVFSAIATLRRLTRSVRVGT